MILYKQDKYGNTLLNIAVQSGHFDLVELLLKHGANPNIPNVSIPFTIKACW